MKSPYYDIRNILNRDCQYNLIIGERSNGKTYGVLKYGLERYFKTKEQMAIIRRWDTDLRGKRGATIFEALVNNGEIKRMSKGEWTGIYYYSSRWYLCKYDEKEKRILSEEPFAYGFAINQMEHDKSSSYPNVTTILFDEFLTRGTYLTDEFVLFMNVLSTIIRDRTNVKIFMCGNTVNQYCPYFTEMGLTKIKDMKPGDIEIYTYGDSNLKVAIEFSDFRSKNKGSNVYFAFNNPKLNMIKGTGKIWEMDIYPHCPIKYKPKDIIFMYFIEFDNETLQCEVIQVEDLLFTYIHRKTTPLKEKSTDLIYTPNYDPRPNFRRKITKTASPIEKKLVGFFARDKVFYQDNEVGEIVRNYIEWCYRDK